MRLFFTDGAQVLSIDTRREWFYYDDKRQNKDTPIIQVSPEDFEHIERELDFNMYGETWHDKGDTIPCGLDDLRPEELEELKQNYCFERYPGADPDELARLAEAVTPEQLQEAYSNTVFEPADFLCNSAGILI